MVCAGAVLLHWHIGAPSRALAVAVAREREAVDMRACGAQAVGEPKTIRHVLEGVDVGRVLLFTLCTAAVGAAEGLLEQGVHSVQLRRPVVGAGSLVTAPPPEAVLHADSRHSRLGDADFVRRKFRGETSGTRLVEGRSHAQQEAALEQAHRAPTKPREARSEHQAQPAAARVVTWWAQ